MELDGSRLSQDESSKCYTLDTCYHQRQTDFLFDFIRKMKGNDSLPPV